MGTVEFANKVEIELALEKTRANEVKRCSVCGERLGNNLLEMWEPDEEENIKKTYFCPKCVDELAVELTARFDELKQINFAGPGRKLLIRAESLSGP